jgi:3-oxoacyl-[acyl-carrier protein] reductase
MDLGLKGKVAMVAGASKGLGYAVARALAAEGVKVSVSSRNEASVSEAAKKIAAETYMDTLGMAADVKSAESLAAWHAKTMEKFGGVDLLYVNAGGPPAGLTLSFDDEVWKTTFEQLVLSAVRMVRLAVPSMKSRGGGAIVVASSTTVKEPVPNLALSNIVRSSVSALSKTLANELAADNIRVNQLMPGRIDTDRVRELDAIRGKAIGASPEDVRAMWAQTMPLGRYGKPEEFAAGAVFLFSDAAKYITGASLQIDGGMIKGVL